MVSATSEEIFPTTESWSLGDFIDRLHRYESATRHVVQTEALLGFWGEPFHEQMLTVAPKRLAGQFATPSGLPAWLALRWYPISLLSYSGGIAAVSARRYSNVRQLLLLPIEDPESRFRRPLVATVTKRISDVESAFKMMPGHDRFFTPRSEYVYKLLQPELDTALSLGSEYEACFDEFEILYALEYAHQNSIQDGGFWGPPGRFGWKYERGEYGSPYHLLVSEAKARGNNWEPVRAGLFGGSIDRFLEVANKYSEYLARLHWR